MGWTNYIIIDELKLAIEISRHINDLHSYEKDSLDYLVEEKDVDDLEDTRVNQLTIKELAVMVMTHDRVYSINGIEPDKFLLYWLTAKQIDYEIVSEHNVNFDELEQKGYAIISMYPDKNGNENKEDNNDTWQDENKEDNDWQDDNKEDDTWK